LSAWSNQTRDGFPSAPALKRVRRISAITENP
jgi:hypothetical protein